MTPPPIWLGLTPTGTQLEGMPLDWFRNAIDQLLAETVPLNYWLKVTASREAKEQKAR